MTPAGADPTAGLPPMPDLWGAPRPPAGPHTAIPRPYAMVHAHLDPHAPPPRWMLGPPDEPPLEFAAVRTSERWTQALIDAAWYGVVGLALLGFMAWWGGSLTFFLNTLWFIAAFTVFMFGVRWWTSDIPGWIVAGSRWVAAGTGHPRRRRWRLAYVYELAKVEIRHPETPGGIKSDNQWDLMLYQNLTSGRVTGLDKALAEVNPALWALVYNGVLHSAACGAQIDNLTRELLGLDPE